MELQGDRLIPSSVAQTWDALNDPETLKACIAGCETLERNGDDGFVAVVAVRVGPVSAKFKGNLKLTNVVPPNSYTINFDGQGGVAGFGKGSADVALTDEAGQTRLKYLARAQVGGKMAQVGSRLIDAAAGKIAEDFFKAFEAKLGEMYPAAAQDVPLVAAGEAAGTASTTASTPAPATPPVGPPTASSASPAATRLPSAASEPSPKPAGNTLWWVIGAVVVVLAVVYFNR